MTKIKGILLIALLFLTSTTHLFAFSNNIIEDVSSGNIEAVKECLFNDISPNTRNVRNITIIMIAIKNRHEDIVYLLLEHGANPHIIDKTGHNAFTYAARRENFELLLYLIEYHDEHDDHKEEFGWKE